MNHPILKAGTNVGLIRTHKRGKGRIKFERQFTEMRNIPLLLGNAVRKDKASQIVTLAHGCETPQSRHQRHMSLEDWEQSSTKAAQGLPQLANGLLDERLNEPPNSQVL